MESQLPQQHFYFIGLGGAGMSAIAQFLAGKGKKVSGSDRQFAQGARPLIREQLEAQQIACFEQDGSGLLADVDVVVISTAIESDNIELTKAHELQIPVMLRADLLALICAAHHTIALAGTSGKSTTTAMLYHVLEFAGLSPSLITGAGLISLQKQGLPGNAVCGKSDYLLIEADESDGTLVKYHPQVGVLLNIDKDHKDLKELLEIFTRFRSQCNQFITNHDHPLARSLSLHPNLDFGEGTLLEGKDFFQQGFGIQFSVAETNFKIPIIGKHNMENALAAIAVSRMLGVSIARVAQALSTYPGIHRRHQYMGYHQGIHLIDDYAHNPAKIAASIRACQPVAKRLIAWFQPHGYGPTKFIRQELVEELVQVLRPEDEIWMSEIYYAGGTAIRDISAADLINDLQQKGILASFEADRVTLFQKKLPGLKPDTVILLMGARDPGLESFASLVWQELIRIDFT